MTDHTVDFLQQLLVMNCGESVIKWLKDLRSKIIVFVDKFCVAAAEKILLIVVCVFLNPFLLDFTEILSLHNTLIDIVPQLVQKS